VRILTTVPESRIGEIDPQLLTYPLGILNLTVRATNCLRDVATIDALLALNEVDLTQKRNFGRTSLLDVRRRLVHFCIDHLALPPGHPVRLALYDPHPSLKLLWEAPPQERTLREVVEEILDCLSRADELREVGSWPASPTSVGPPRRCDYETASLAEVCEAFFNCLKEREYHIVEQRYGPLDTPGATLAEVGQELGLTRERVRQIVQGCLNRLMRDDERKRREPLTAAVRCFVADQGEVVREQDMAHFLIGHFPAPHKDVGPLVRVLLEVEPEYTPVGQGVWVAGAASPSLVLEIQDGFHSLLRAAGARMRDDALLSELQRKNASYRSLKEPFLRACLRADDRLGSDESRQYGLVEWQWLLPRTLDDYVYLALRSAARPRHYMWITQQVNALIPDGQEVTPRDVHGTLLDRNDMFMRYREGTYTLREWETGPRESLSDLVSSILRENGRPMTLDEIVTQAGREQYAPGATNGSSPDRGSVAALLESTNGYWRTPDGRYGLNDWPLRRAEAGVAAEAVS
jgi:sigma-70-like protein/RNA polymerase alpha subunit